MNEREIFEKAIEIQNLEQRRAFLVQSCDGDAALRKRLDELLASHDQASGFLQVPAVPPLPSAVSRGDQATIELPQAAGGTGNQYLSYEDDDSHATPDMSFLQPSTKPGSIGALGHYEILQVLGQGAFGIVFKAFDEKLHRLVAIKGMNPQLAATSPPRKRFLREARSVAAVKHENVVQVHAVEEQPLPYLVMEYVDGLTLQQKLENAGPLEEAEILHLGRQMAAGLAAAHEKGIIHRDIKPGNILLESGAEQKVKITDFGLARAADDATMTRTGTIAGTPMYMAPEQAMGQTLDHRADLFSLGSVLYQMTCGRAPFRGSNAMAVLKRVVDEVPRPIQDILPEAPDWLCAIIAKLHAKNPDDRFQTAKEVADLFARCQSELQLTGKVSPISGLAKTTAPSDKSPQTTETGVAVKPSETKVLPVPTSRRGFLVAAGTIIALLAVVAITELAGITHLVRKSDNSVQSIAKNDSVTTKSEKDQSRQPVKASGWHGWPADAPPPAIAPFDAAQAQKHQKEWADYLKLPVEYTNSLGMKFVLIPPGEFLMGSTPAEIEEASKHSGNNWNWESLLHSEAPQHTRIVTAPFYLGCHELTQKQYESLVGTNPSGFSKGGTVAVNVAIVEGIDTSNFPVECVEWDEANEFCNKLSDREGLPQIERRTVESTRSRVAIGYRLPTEAEWEFACRSGTTTRFWCGDSLQQLDRAGWFRANSGSRTHAVGELAANPFGLFDTHGSVGEWCQDRWQFSSYSVFASNGESSSHDQRDPKASRVVRGGDWADHASYSRSSSRSAQLPTDRFASIGFRVALPADAVKELLKRPEGAKQPESVALPDAPPSSEALIDFAAERRAAERLLRLGKGKVNLVNKDRQPIGELKEPLPVEPFSIHSVEFISADLTDEELQVLAGCQAIETLKLFHNPRVTAAGLSAIGPQSHLKVLSIRETGVGNEGLAWLASSPALIELDTWRTPISVAGWESLPKCPALTRLDTSGLVGDTGLSRIVEQCPQLQSLVLWDWAIADLSPVARLLKLSSLHTGPSALSENGIDTILKHPVLDDLSVDSPTPDGLQQLRRLAPKLKRFAFREQLDEGKFATGASWEPVTQMTGLPAIDISAKIAVDGPALSRIAAMPSVQQVRILDETAPEFKTKFRSFTPDDVAAFRKARPDVELLISGQTFPALSDWPGKFEGSTSIAEWTELPPGSPAPAIGTFAPDVAQQTQAEWARHLQVEPEITNEVGMKFRLIPPSEAVVKRGSLERPRVALQRISNPYFMGTTEVTVGQFKQFVAATGYVTDAERSHDGLNLQNQPDPSVTWKTPGYVITDDLPVSVISPADAQAFCDWLNTQSKTADLTSEISNGKSLYRLPTELEWELASRAGGAGDYAFAGTAERLLDYAWTSENVAGKPIPVQPVATKLANPFGLHDVLGNVWESYTWAKDSLPGVAGASHRYFAPAVTMNFRVPWTHRSLPDVGFRVLRQLEASPAPKFAEQPVLTARHAPLGPQATVTHPAPIPGLRSWTIELAAHQSYVFSIAWSPKGDVIATTSDDMSVRLWDRDGHLKSILLGHSGFAGGVSFSPDGTRLATTDGSTDSTHPSTLRIWDVSGTSTDGRRSRETSVDPAKPELSQVRLLAVVPLPRGCPCVAWSPDGKQIATGMNQQVAVVDVETGHNRSIKVEGNVLSLAWSPDGKTMCVGLQTRMLPTLFDVASGEKLATLTAPDAKPDNRYGAHVAWSPDGRWLAGAYGKQVRIWDATSRKHLRTITTEFGLVKSLAWHKESQLLAVAGEGGSESTCCFIFDTTSGEIAARVPSFGSAAYDVAWSPDGTELVTHSHTKGVLQFIDGKTGTLLRSGTDRGQNRLDLTLHATLVLSRDGSRFHVPNAAVSERLEFDAETGQLLEHRKSPPWRLLATASDERWRAYAKSDTEVVIEPKRFDRDPVTITTPGLNALWRSDPSGERIAQAFEQQVRIWDASTGQPLGTLPQSAKLWSFEWSPDGQQLATIADDKTIRVWDTQTNKLTAEFKQFPQELSLSGYLNSGGPALAWTRDGRRLWIPLGEHAGLLDLSTGRVAPVENFSNGNYVGSLTLAPDGDRLLAWEGYGWTFLRDRDGSRQLLGQSLGATPHWHPDSRRFLSGADPWDRLGVRGFDVSMRRRLGTLWPVLTSNHWLCIGPTGHYRGSDGVDSQIVYLAQLDDGSNITLSPAEFSTRFTWKNDPKNATLLKLAE